MEGSAWGPSPFEKPGVQGQSAQGQSAQGQPGVQGQQSAQAQPEAQWQQGAGGAFSQPSPPSQPVQPMDPELVQLLQAREELSRRRTIFMLTAAAGTVLLMAITSLLPTPFVAMSPGPVFDTLGDFDGKPLVQVEDHKTYPTEGSLYLTTVSISGGPRYTLNIWGSLGQFWRPEVLVVPEHQIYPEGTKAEEIETENRVMMDDSQTMAAIAALRQVGIEVPTKVLVNGLAESSPADSPLKAGDYLLSINGQPVPDLEALTPIMDAIAPGEEISITVLRDESEMTVQLTTGRGDKGQAVMGIYVSDQGELPFDVNYALEDIGGPSAGMIFALAIADKLTPGSMTGGKAIAGTGTIDAAGTVGEIGGIEDKFLGAQDQGVEYFLAPAKNCDEAPIVPEGLKVYRVKTLADAVAAVEAIGKDDFTSEALVPCRVGI